MATLACADAATRDQVKHQRVRLSDHGATLRLIRHGVLLVYGPLEPCVCKQSLGR